MNRGSVGNAMRTDVTTKRQVVLVIEDDDAVARVLRRILEPKFEVRRARGLREGLALIEGGEYAALLCDWDLGDGTGDIALARSAERQPVARRVLYSARLPVDAPIGIADVVLQKPCPAGVILAALSDKGALNQNGQSENNGL